MDLWNVKNLESPPISTYLAKSYIVDIVTLHNVLTEAIATFTNQKQLQREAAILSRCIYRMKLKFRSDTAFKAMEKVNRALLQYLRMDIPQLLQTLIDLVPKKYTQSMYLPSRNILHYVLVRLQGLSKLLVRAADQAKTAAQLMGHRINLGHFWNIALICYGVCSRLFVLIRNMLRACCKIFSQLLPFAETLQIVGVAWLPSDYQLPADLESWLGTDIRCFAEAKIKKPKLKTPSILKIFRDIDADSDVEFCGDYVEIDDDVEVVNEFIEVRDDENVDNGLLNKQKSRLWDLTMDEDIGEVVETTSAPALQDNFKNKTQKVVDNHTKPKRKKRKKHKSKSSSLDLLIGNIKTLNDLQLFSKDFKKLQDQHSEFFKRVDKMQCRMLHGVIKKHIKKAKKCSADQTKMDLYISKAREALKVNLGE